MIDYSNSAFYSVGEKDGVKFIFRNEGKYCFGPFRISHFYDIEKSEDVVRSANKMMKTVEFVCIHEGRLTFVEAKSSFPKLMLKEDFTQRLDQRVKMENTPKIISENLVKFWDSLSKLPQRFKQSTDIGIIPENVMDKLKTFSDSLSDEFLQTIDPLWIVPRSVHEICDKFINSWRLLLSIAYGRETSNDISPEILNRVRNTKTPLRFLLIVDIEGRIVEAIRNNIPKDKDYVMSKTELLQRAEEMTHTFLEVANSSLTEHLEDRLIVDRKICRTLIKVITVSQAYKMGLIYSNPNLINGSPKV